MTEISYLAKITKFLTGLPPNPDSTHNTGRALGEAYMWRAVAKYAEACAERAMKEMVREGIIPNREESPLDPGEHDLASSPHFACSVKVSQPIERFNPDDLAMSLARSKYKVPMPFTKQAVEKAKKPTKSSYTYIIVEK